MRFWKEIRGFLPVIALIPLFLFYLDKPVIQAVRQFREAKPLFYRLWEYMNPVIDFISHGTPQIVAAFCLLLGGIYFRHRIQRVGWSMTVGFLSAGLLVQVIKHIVGRARPRVTDDTLFIGPNFQGDYDSFPSGHTAAVFCLALILSHYFPRLRPLFYSVAVLTGLDRIEGLSHFPADVLASIVIGTLVGRLVLLKIPYPWSSRYVGEKGEVCG